MKVLFPAPGTPEIPIRQELPVLSDRRRSNSRATGRCWGALLSISVIALDRAARLPLVTESASSSGVGIGNLLTRSFRKKTPPFSLTPAITVVVNSVPAFSGTHSGRVRPASSEGDAGVSIGIIFFATVCPIAPREGKNESHSHSIVAGGLLDIS